VHAHVSAARRHVLLEGGFLRGREHVTGGVQEDDRFVVRQVVRGERRRVLGDVDGEVVVRAEGADRVDALVDRGTALTGGLGEDQHLIVVGLLGVSGCGRRQGDGDGDRRQPSKFVSEHGKSSGVGSRLSPWRGAMSAKGFC
jgi:hypothetical protein